MTDIEALPEPGDRSRPDTYSIPAPSATPSLREKLLCEIKKNVPLPFPRYLELVLYDPDLGYYARTEDQVGRAGDFYTSVSVGPMFGQLLARRFFSWWDSHDRPASWRILEIGAHDGKLAADVLATLAQISPAAWAALEYAIPEPLPRLRAAQEKRLAPHAANLRIAPSLAELAAAPLPGIAFGNEILDALPFHLVRRTGGDWRELHVTAGPSGELALSPFPIDPESTLSRRIGRIGGQFPDGYETEIRTNETEFLEMVSSCIADGLLLFIDYGYAAPEYYDVSRSSGTLRTYGNHRAAEDPLDRPGQLDITAHVDFTALARAAGTLGFRPVQFSTQGSYLTHLAKPLLLAENAFDAKTLAQFQSLTHPAHLGGRFHAIEFEKNALIPANISHRLAL